MNEIKWEFTKNYQFAEVIVKDAKLKYHGAEFTRRTC